MDGSLFYLRAIFEDDSHDSRVPGRLMRNWGLSPVGRERE